MGCDIHPVCERLLYAVAPDSVSFGSWECAGRPDDSRCYRFFNALAGVRGNLLDDPAPLVPVGRGLPPRSQWDEPHFGLFDGGHNEGWCTLGDLVSRSLDDEWMRQREMVGPPLTMWSRWIEYGRFIANHFTLPDDAVRFVFNFDS